MNIFVSYKLRGLIREDVIAQLRIIQIVCKEYGVTSYIYDLETEVTDPDSNRTYLRDVLPKIKQSDELRVLHNHKDKSVGMMMEVSAAFALGKRIVVWREEMLSNTAPYDMDQCANQIISYKDSISLQRKIKDYIVDLEGRVK